MVSRVKENSNVGGPDNKYRNKVNYIQVAHADGTYASYMHLGHEGVLVNVGETAERGQLIGYSGDTGYAGSPHLHFEVTIKESMRAWTKATRFYTRKGIETLAQGSYYRRPPEEDCSGS